ncbi:DUF6893 family small protein [Nonomuraea jiangxiensis]|uniref:Uncharacterized protein n=1 Tax=Nonomuraea jiangxiensis TaxID=633440 RepID=A0A1G8T9Y9_9ACTN|nr:hypothetical protein SAMN05421869_11094 [Nonomuraea jiangxiensis]
MWKSRVVTLLVLCGLAAFVAHQWPQIHRYLKMERM